MTAGLPTPLVVTPAPGTRRSTFRWPGGLATGFIFASGAAALAHQLLWMRRLVDVLGAGSDTFAQVVGAFFAGLALGSWWAARHPATAADGWRRAALAEGTVAALALLLLPTLGVPEALRRGLGTGPWLKTLLPALFILPPAAAMGLVLPAIVSARPDAASLRLYLWNTLGGVAGLALTAFLLLPRLGLTGAAFAALGVNALLALAAAGGQRRVKPAAGVQTAFPAPAAKPALPAAGLLAFASGFLVLGLETLAQHQLAQVAINSLFSAATVLGVVLLALVGAATLAARLTRAAPPAVRLPAVLAGAAVVVAWQPVLFLLARPGLANLPYELAPAAYYPRLILLAGFTLGPAFLAAGLVFPLLLATRPDAARLARWLALNGLGGWLGAELASVWLGPRLGLWGATVALGGGYALLALFTTIQGIRPDAQRVAETVNGPSSRPAARRRWPVAAALALVALGAWAARPLPQVRVAPGETLAAVALGREGVVATVHRGADDWRMLFNNTYTLGGSRAAANQERQALLPLLLHGRAQSAGLLGVATGSTLAGATLAPGLERIEAAELSPRVLAQARAHFGPFNRDVFADPRVSVTIEDARWFVAGAEARFDVIVGDLFLPWRTGEGRLYSREHFAAVRRALRPDGLFCQWLPLFQLTRTQFDAIARTFLAEFPDAFAVRGDFYTDLPILGLVGGRPLAALDWAAVAAQCDRLRAAGQTADPLVRHVEGVAMLLVGPLPPPLPGPVITLANGWLEWDAGRNIVGLRTPWFTGVPAAEYVRDIHRATLPTLPPGLQPAHDAGQFWLTLEVAARTRSPHLDNLRAQRRERLPAALAADPDASWEAWPARAKPVEPAGPRLE